MKSDSVTILTGAEKPTADLLACLRAALAAPDREARDFFALGQLLHRQGQPEAALAAFEAAVDNEPGRADIWHAVAALRMGLGRPRAALAAGNEALRLDPDGPDSLFDVAVILAALDDLAAAEHCYRKLLDNQPDHRGALLNLPLLLLRTGRAAEAKAWQEKALALFPEHAACHFNLGETLVSLGEYAAALSAYERALELDPTYATAAVAAAVVLAVLGEVEEANRRLGELRVTAPDAVAAFHSPLLADRLAAFPELDPGRLSIIAGYERQKSCDWATREDDVRRFAGLINGQYGNKPVDNPDLPFLALGLALNGADRHRLAAQAASRIAASLRRQPLARSVRGERRRLRVGYVSGDFRPHPTAQLSSRMFGLHDRERFEILAYSTGPGAGSEERRQVEASVDGFCDAARFDAAILAQRIARDGIDILVDIAGYTMYSGLAAFALRPAPLQISYLGYLATSGASWMDYAILDRQVMSEEERPWWPERIVHLPHTLYICDDAPAPQACGGREAYGLPAKAFVYCSFNTSWKVDPATFDLWMAVLRAVEHGVLWLLDDTPVMQANLRREAAARGISPDRLIFAQRVPRREHLARYRLADAFLDALPCNAHTTAIEALAAGVPLVTLPGTPVHARVAAGLLKAHGVPELVAASPAEFVATAVRLAADPEWGRGIRRRVQQREGSHLFCTERRVREIERAYEMMWERHRAGLPPADFDVPPLD